MSSLNFDSNSWYQIAYTSSDSLDGTILYESSDEGRAGAVFIQGNNGTDPELQWQIYTYNSSYYCLRTKASGSVGYLVAGLFVGEQTAQLTGRTLPGMRSFTDDSMFWKISPWGDGTFYFTNAANGSAWHLAVDDDSSLMEMTSNITAPQPEQSFQFTQLGEINDVQYSSIVTPATPVSASATSATSATSSTSTPASLSPTPTTSPIGTISSAPKNHSGLSTGASVAIGASIGGVAVLLLISAFFGFRRRKRRSAGARRIEQETSQFLPRKELHGNDIKVLPPAELHGNPHSAELLADGTAWLR